MDNFYTYDFAGHLVENDNDVVKMKLILTQKTLLKKTQVNIMRKKLRMISKISN